MYGLPKIHKDGAPLRPIISAVKTYNFELAKYLDEILKPFIDSTYTLVDTYDFVNKVSTIDGVTIFHDLTRLELEDLLITCTQKSHFQFNGIYYDQKDGVAMGSPLGPLFANAFIGDFEIKHRDKSES